MAIRIRQVEGKTVALCAVEVEPMPGDIYLSDAVHYALATKFALDYRGFMDDSIWDAELARLMETQKVRDARETLENLLQCQT